MICQILGPKLYIYIIYNKNLYKASRENIYTYTLWREIVRAAAVILKHQSQQSKKKKKNNNNKKKKKNICKFELYFFILYGELKRFYKYKQKYYTYIFIKLKTIII